MQYTHCRIVVITYAIFACIHIATALGHFPAEWFRRNNRSQLHFSRSGAQNSISALGVEKAGSQRHAAGVGVRKGLMEIKLVSTERQRNHSRPQQHPFLQPHFFVVFQTQTHIHTQERREIIQNCQSKKIYRKCFVEFRLFLRIILFLFVYFFLFLFKYMIYKNVFHLITRDSQQIKREQEKNEDFLTERLTFQIQFSRRFHEIFVFFFS